MTTYMNVTVSSSDVATEMLNDHAFAYDVFSEVAYYLGGNNEKFVNNLFKEIFEEENTELLNLPEQIVVQFKHLKEQE